MGWWSCNIMGGDTPLDCIENISDELGVSFDDDTPEGDSDSHFGMYPLSKSILEKNMKMLTTKMDAPKWYDKNISYQVLGMVVLYYGVKITKKLKTKIIAEAKKDEWGRDEAERKVFIAKFINQLESYTTGERFKDDNQGDFYHLTPNSVRFAKENNYGRSYLR